MSTPLEKACGEGSSLAGFTFVEVVVVIVLVAVVATISFPGFTKSREHAIGREAKTNLQRIAEAEKNYRLEREKYYPETNTTKSDITEINNELRTYMRNAADSTTLDWTYSISSSTASGGGEDYLAIATRKSSVGAPYSNCQYYITNGMDDPLPNSSSNCP